MISLPYNNPKTVYYPDLSEPQEPEAQISLPPRITDELKDKVEHATEVDMDDVMIRVKIQVQK